MSYINGTYDTQIQDHHVDIEKRPGEDYYICVRYKDGSYCYDGFWENSKNKTLEEAIAEAKAGSLIEDKS